MLFHVHDDRDAAARRLAAIVADRLRGALAVRAEASLVLSGGSSPLGLFAHLSRQSLDWSRVTVLASDERWVPSNDPASNEGAIRRHLLRNDAAEARLLSLYQPNQAPRAACETLRATLSEIPRPFDTVVLGMGLDGHTASLFPDARNIDALLASESECVVPDLGAAAQPRVSLGLRCLLDARCIDLLFFGADKRAVYERACLPGPAPIYPVRAILHQDRTPHDVFWAD